jgi:hypothetical protein
MGSPWPRFPPNIWRDFTEYYWGYTKRDAASTSEYAVEHSRWSIYRVVTFDLDVDFGEVYGPEFEFLSSAGPSPSVWRKGRKLR